MYVSKGVIKFKFNNLLAIYEGREERRNSHRYLNRAHKTKYDI